MNDRGEQIANTIKMQQAKIEGLLSG